MPERSSTKDTQCCAPVLRGYRLLTFPDGTQAGVIGLNEIFEEMCNAGKKPDKESASEIAHRLAAKNYITPSARSRYEEVALKEYERFLQGRTLQGAARNAEAAQAERRPVKPVRAFIARLFALFRR